jgi:hypothetical protein
MLPQIERSLTGGCCCGGRQASPRLRRGGEIAAGAISLGVWALMPKCPLCLAAYVTLWTGIGLSLAAATYLRWSFLLLSAALLLYLALRRPWRALAGS